MKIGRKMNFKKYIILAFLGLFIMAYFLFDLSSFFSIENLKNYHLYFSNFYQKNPLLTISGFFFIYFISSSLSIPIVLPLTVFAGSIFGLLYGTLIVSFASSLGASLCFLLSRFLIGSFLEKKLTGFIKEVIEQFEKEGLLYLFSLRLIPLVPFFITNVAMSLTRLPLKDFYLISQLGMLPGTLLYVYAGQSLSEIENLSDLLSIKWIIIFILIACLPWLMKWLLKTFKK